MTLRGGAEPCHTPVMRSHLRIVVLLALPVLLPGCLFFGFGCDIVGSAFQSKAPPGTDVCAIFNGDCCVALEDFGQTNCGPAFDDFDIPHIFPCGTIHGTSCGCVDPETKDRAPAEARVSRLTTYAVPPFTYTIALPYAGFDSAHRLAFDVVADAYQTFHGTVTFASGFVFHGFTALGPANTTIGSYGIDIDGDESADFALPIRAATADLAYGDIDGDGQQTAADATIQHLADTPSAGQHTFELTIPWGGDRAPSFTRSFLAFRAIVALSAGVLGNPSTPGSYGVQGSFTSVDPDTGDASDGTGRTPTSLVVPPVALDVEPSPLALVDHFLCYKTKPSKGLICSEAASANRGAICATDADCGGTVGSCGKNKLAKGIQRVLADPLGQFAARTVDVKKPLDLCTPADAGNGRHDDATHLRTYRIGLAKGAPKPAVTAGLVVVNALGTIGVDVKAPDLLLEPSATALGAPASPLGPNAVDDYACYKTKLVTKRCAGGPARTCKSSLACGADGPCLGKLPKGLQIALSDRFTTGPKLFDVKKPTRLCVPAMQDGSPIQSEHATLMCYQVKAAAGAAPHTPVVGALHTTNAISRDRLDTVVEDEVCVPSLTS